MSGKFVGAYVADMREATIAAFVSGANAAFIGEPGWGKTEVGEDMGTAVFGDLFVPIFIEPSTPPEEVKGKPDMGLLLTENKYEIVTKGTAQDPDAMAVMLDELYRGTDVVFDFLLKPLSGRDVNMRKLPDDQVKTFIITANFVVENDRTRAMRDRIDITQFPKIGQIDWGALVRECINSIGSGMDIGDGLPTIDEIRYVRSLKAEDYPQANDAVHAVTMQLIDEAMKGVCDENGKPVKSFVINPRRVKSWAKVLYRFSAWITGDPNFSVVPDRAKRVLQWMYPSVNEEEADYWRQIAGAMADPIQSAVDLFCKEAFDAAKATMQKEGVNKQVQSMELGGVLADGERHLRELATQLGVVDQNGLPTDIRIIEAIDMLKRSYGDIVTGKTPW